jgi:hypothetical protein
MDKFHQHLKKYCPFLYSSNEFRLVETHSSKSFGNALLIFEYGNIRLKFVSDRDQIFLDFQPVKPKKNEWFSIDIVKQMITGEVENSAEVNSKNAEFLKTNLRNIEHLFSKSNKKGTFKELKKLERERAKRLFS